MYRKLRSLIFLLLLLFTAALHAQHNVSPLISTNVSSSTTDNETWWGYFDGNYNTVNETGMGDYMPCPVSYSCAIKIKRDNPEVLGKVIKALRFAFFRLDYIEDVKIWMSTILPITPDDADICCQTIGTSSLVSLNEDYAVNEIPFDVPYQFGNKDIYVGYSFTVTSNKNGINIYPIVVTGSETAENAFFADWGTGWNTIRGNDNGNLAIMVLLSDGVVLPGDVNYDVKVNVGDISSVIEYILGGIVGAFNKDAADIDGNGEINIVDAASVADIILGRYEKPGGNESQDVCDGLNAVSDENGTVISLNTDNAYKAFQMDVVVPEGFEITSVVADPSLASTHSIRFSKVADDRYRIAAYSAAGSVIGSDVKKLITIGSTSDNLKIENIIFATSALTAQHFSPVSLHDTAGINNVHDGSRSDTIYSVYGIKTDTPADRLDKGIYIINGKKTIIR